MCPHLVASTYFGIQAGSVAIWWAVLFGWPSTRPLFFPGESLDSAQLLFATADCLVMVPASIVAARLAHKRSPSARAASWFAAGCGAYAALATVGWAIHAPLPLLSPVLMLLTAAASAYCANQIV
jgi:hypothetical protein